MTIRIELLNHSDEKWVKVSYRDIGYTNDPKEPTNIIESDAGVIGPKDKSEFYIHDHRMLVLQEKDQVSESQSDKNPPPGPQTPPTTSFKQFA